MPIRKVRKLDQTTAGITIPKDDLRLEGLLDEDGKLIEDEHVEIRRVDNGEWRIRRLDDSIPVL